MCPQCGVPSPTVHSNVEGALQSVPPIVESGWSSSESAGGSDTAIAWYYAVGGVTHGPMKWEELEQLARTGQLRSRAFVWGPGFKRWKTTNECPELGVQQLEDLHAAPQFSRPKSPSGKKYLLWVAAAGVIVYLLYTADRAAQDRMPEDAGSAEETRASPSEKTAQTALGELKGSAYYPDMAAVSLQKARDLVQRYPGTPEADSAAAMIPTLEKAAAEYAGREAESREARQREALALKWSYSSDIDPMTSRTSRHARIRSENTISLDFPYEGEQYATLTLRNHPSHGRDVILSIEQGQFLCSSYDGCRVRIRFDEGAAQTWSAIGPSDHSTTVLFIRNFNSFFSHLRGSKVIRIQAEIYEAGAPTFEFEVGGFNQERFASN